MSHADDHPRVGMKIARRNTNDRTRTVERGQPKQPRPSSPISSLEDGPFVSDPESDGEVFSCSPIATECALEDRAQLLGKDIFINLQLRGCATGIKQEEVVEDFAGWLERWERKEPSGPMDAAADAFLASAKRRFDAHGFGSVSYTHLTLPTILLV